MIAIDLGSNTLRVLQMDCKSGEFLYEYQKIVRTADNLIHTGVISSQAKERIIQAINEAASHIDFTKDKIKAVTTEAMRKAKNSLEIIEEIYDQTGVKFEIIDGDTEARLTISAVINRLQALGIVTKNGFAMIDIGGASTEVAFVYNDEIAVQSFSLGIVTLAEAYPTLDMLKSALPGRLEPISEFITNTAKEKSPIVVATAGTPTTVAAMKIGLDFETYEAHKINGMKLDLADMDEQLKRLLDMSEDMRQISVGTGRSDLIATGIVLFKALLGLLGKDECIVVDDGLREGVALEGCKAMSSC
ncbi:MAG: phosphatase [Sulfurovaceae bacterium]|nr:phosphatase [Sulfurovaceae bacterium]